jgi:surface protein
MERLFRHRYEANVQAATAFNGDISKWDVSSVNIDLYVREATVFNGDISKWDVSSVTNMSYMF